MNNLNSRLLGVALLTTALSFQANAQTAQRLQAATYIQNNITVDSLAYSYANSTRPCLPTAILGFKSNYFYDEVTTVGLYDSAINQMQPATMMHDRKEQVISNGMVIRSTDKYTYPGGDVTITTTDYNPTGSIKTQVIEDIGSNGQSHYFNKAEYTYSGGLLTTRDGYIKTGTSGSYTLQSKFTYSYVGGMLTQELQENFDHQTQTLTPLYRYSYAYNSSNQLIQKTSEVFHNNAWHVGHKVLYTYTAAGDLHKETAYMVVNGITNVLQTETVFTYTGSLVSKIDIISYDNNAAVTHTYTTDLTYSPNNQITSVIYSITIPSSSTTYYKKSNYDYNNNNLLEKAYIQVYDTSTQSWTSNTTDSISTYYYEPYTPVSVANTHIEEASVSIFPNPAVNMVNITANWKEPQAFTVAIYNTSGQIIRQWAEEPVTDYKKQIPVTDLSAGTYFISIKGDNTDISKQLTILH